MILHNGEITTQLASKYEPGLAFQATEYGDLDYQSVFKAIETIDR